MPHDTALAFGQEPVYPVTVVQARLIGVMRMRDDKAIDDKIIAVSENDPSLFEAPYVGLRAATPRSWLELSQDLPIVIEIVDAPAKIEAFMPDLEQMVGDGLITLARRCSSTGRHACRTSVSPPVRGRDRSQFTLPKYRSNQARTSGTT